MIPTYLAAVKAQKVTDSDRKRFFEKIEKLPSGCWEWQAYRNADGYGQIWFKGRLQMAHRLSWFIHRGGIPRSHFVCHTCDSPPCVNPDHLFVGTHQDNTDDMIKKGRHRTGAGEKNRHAKLTERDVLLIRSIHKQLPNAPAIARAFNVSTATINAIASGSTWKHLADKLVSNAEG